MPLVRWRRHTPLLFAVVLPILCVARPTHAFWSINPSSPLAICNSPKQQQWPTACTDGVGGMIVAWEDHRDSLTTGPDIYAQHVTGEGQMSAGWPVKGFLIVTPD